MKELDERPAAGDVAAQRTHCLGQRADLDIDAAMQPEMIDCPASIPAEDTARVCIIHHHDAAVLFGERAQLRKRAEIAVHAEYAVGDQQLARSRRKVAQNGPRRVGVAMREYLD